MSVCVRACVCICVSLWFCEFLMFHVLNCVYHPGRGQILITNLPQVISLLSPQFKRRLGQTFPQRPALSLLNLHVDLTKLSQGDQPSFLAMKPGCVLLLGYTGLLFIGRWPLFQCVSLSLCLFVNVFVCLSFSAVCESGVRVCHSAVCGSGVRFRACLSKNTFGFGPPTSNSS